MNILLYKGNFNYNVVNHFIDDLAKYFSKKNHTVYICDLPIDINNDNDLLDLINFLSYVNIDFVFSFNGINAIPIQIYENLNIIFGTVLVDNPFYHLLRLDSLKSKNTFVGLSDEGYLDIAKKYMYEYITTTQITHGGSIAELKSSEKKYDVIVAGDLNELIDFETYINSSLDKLSKEIAIDLYNHAIKNLQKPLYEYLEDIINNFNFDDKLIKTKEFKEAVASIYKVVDLFIRKEMRYKGILELLKNGVEINHFGNCNCNTFSEYSNFKNNGSIQYTQLLNIMNQSKIIIHITSYFKNGSHERVLSAMLNNTLVIANENNYSFNMYKNNESIVFYNPNKENDLTDKVKYYLDNELQRNKITKNAYEITSSFNTWENKANEILEFYSSFKNNIL
ncbi:glycosyltransferase [Romboutsia lituseburensis]|uniref:glycosyltransferase n=1 Tax=Romboutsia lituseburensis TaxID=1537 RepID=UPI00215AA3B0|nr:glycosyltransferase [Romboutsia lituseburensis]MCR8744758.1 glycosyltransferase [Romboutsia lituseburensis]